MTDDMPALLKEIIERLGNIEVDERCGPRGEIQKGDHIIGVMSEGLKKLNALRNKTEQEAKRIALQIIAIVDETRDKEHPEIAKLHPAFELASAKHRAVGEFFWYALQVEFPEVLSKSSVGIRKDWQVVWTEKKTEIVGIEVIISPISPEELGLHSEPAKKTTLH
ncbi:MAG: hypothetical protein Q8R12_01805 [bacterium]|nr:hypothetical protein [bacterium]